MENSEGYVKFSACAEAPTVLSKKCHSKTRQKRPDMQIYVPRALREKKQISVSDIPCFKKEETFLKLETKLEGKRIYNKNNELHACDSSPSIEENAQKTGPEACEKPVNNIISYNVVSGSKDGVVGFSDQPLQIKALANYPTGIHDYQSCSVVDEQILWKDKYSNKLLASSVNNSCCNKILEKSKTINAAYFPSFVSACVETKNLCASQTSDIPVRVFQPNINSSDQFSLTNNESSSIKNLNVNNFLGCNINYENLRLKTISDFTLENSIDQCSKLKSETSEFSLVSDDCLMQLKAEPLHKLSSTKCATSDVEALHNFSADSNDINNSSSIIDDIRNESNKTENSAVNLHYDIKENDSWDSIYNEAGECLNPEILERLTALVGDVEIHTAKQSYSALGDCNDFDEEYGHILEIYNFPVEFNTQDLIAALSSFKTQDYNIIWVDDCHALGVFSSTVIAMQALEIKHPVIKLRPLSQGIKESKIKARTISRTFLTHKPRPATSVALARRLVSGALGLKIVISEQQEKNEKQKIKEAKEKKRNAARQKQNIWDGVVS